MVQTSRWVQALSVGGMVYSSTTVGNAQKKKTQKAFKAKRGPVGTSNGLGGPLDII